MSIWTHVAGVIRFDGIRGMMNPPELGVACSFEDDADIWEKCDVPLGSEGSLQYELSTNKDISSIAAWVATFHGDLRDYSDVDEIKAYFNRVTEGQMVRQGVFTVEVEGGASLAFVFSGDEWFQLSMGS